MKKILGIASLIVLVFLFVSCKPLETKYQVEFKTEGGTNIKSQEVIKGNKAYRPVNDPTKEGFDFVDWFLNLDDEEPYNFDSIITDNISIYAKWKEKEIIIDEVFYTIDFETNGGNKIDSINVIEGNLLNQPPNPIKEGFDFVGWYSNSGLVSPYDFNEPVYSNIILYAKWEEIIEVDVYYKVTYETNGGSEIKAETVLEGETASLPEIPVKAGYRFVGWYLNNSFETVYDFNDPVLSDLTIYVKWEKILEEDILYTVKFNSNGGSNVNDQKIKEGNLVVKPKAPTKVNHVFSGWYQDSALVNEYNFNEPVKSEITLYAKWTENGKYKITFNSNGGSAVSSQMVYINNQVNKPISPTKSNYFFGGWFIDEKMTIRFDFKTKITKDLVLYAKWHVDSDEVDVGEWFD